MLKDFIRLAWTINRRDPHWVPPLYAEVREFLDAKRHPFYEYGAAEKFIAYRDGVPVGRILVSDNPVLNHRKGTNNGNWGMFECVDDDAVAKALFDTARAWARNNHGRTSILGPVDYSTTYPIGLLVDGFDTPPRYGMNHNPPYYRDLVTRYGMECVQGMYAWWFPITQEMLLKWKRRTDWVQKRTQVECRTVSRSTFRHDVNLCREVYNNSMKDNWNYSELTDSEIRYFAKRLLQFASMNLVFLALDGEKPVGFAVSIPDLNEAIKPLDGKLFPTGIFRFLLGKRKIRTARMMILCVDPEYRRRGLSELLIMRTLEFGLYESGFRHAELGWTYRDNDAVNRIIASVGATPYKSYDLYEIPCDE